MSEIKGTPVCVIYQDNADKKSGKIYVCVPGTQFSAERIISGPDLRVRSQAAGAAIASLVSNFIENNPVIANEIGVIAVKDRVSAYPVKAAAVAKPSPKSKPGPKAKGKPGPKPKAKLAAVEPDAEPLKDPVPPSDDVDGFNAQVPNE